MKLPIRDMTGETDIQAEPLERPALALPGASIPTIRRRKSCAGSIPTG
jgi:hypothetical protein